MQRLQLVLKGLAMGAANVIPGVSGGTIAFITGIFERLITSLKRIDLVALRFLFTRRWIQFAERIDFWFLFYLFLGVGIGILSLARVFEWALDQYESFTFAFFFGLILASILGVGKQISQLNIAVVVSFVIGCGLAVGLAFLPPASANENVFYVFVCGIVAVCSMILPGISGSYILLLMGNYILVLSAISTFDLSILLPLILGVVIGLILFSRLLSWLFLHFKDATISALTGFVTGSLLIIWPWKKTIYTLVFEKQKATRYEWLFPEVNPSFFLALGLMSLGFGLVLWMDRSAKPAQKST